MNDFFIAILLHFYDLNYLKSTKSRLSNKKLGIVPDVTLTQNSKMDIVIKFQVSIFKNTKLDKGGSFSPPPPQRKISWLRGNVE